MHHYSHRHDFEGLQSVINSRFHPFCGAGRAHEPWVDFYEKRGEDAAGVRAVRNSRENVPTQVKHLEGRRKCEWSNFVNGDPVQTQCPSSRLSILADNLQMLESQRGTTLEAKDARFSCRRCRGKLTIPSIHDVSTLSNSELTLECSHNGDFLFFYINSSAHE